MKLLPRLRRAHCYRGFFFNYTSLPLSLTAQLASSPVKTCRVKILFFAISIMERILFHSCGVDKWYTTACVRFLDTDIFVVLIKYASSFTITIIYDTGVKKKRRVLPITDIAISISGCNVTFVIRCIAE